VCRGPQLQDVRKKGRGQRTLTEGWAGAPRGTHSVSKERGGAARGRMCGPGGKWAGRVRSSRIGGGLRFLKA